MSHTIMIAGLDLDFRSFSIADDTPTGRQILAACDATPFDQHIVLQWLPGGDLEEISADEVAKVESATPPRFIVTKGDRLFRLVLEDRSVSWPAPSISEQTLRALADIPATSQLFLRQEGQDKLIDSDTPVKLNEAGVETIYARAGAWKLNVQGVVITSSAPMVLVRSALEQAGFNPDQGWIIVLKSATTKRQVSLEDHIDLREPGIEKLRLTPREINNGEARQVGNRDFALTDEDQAGLDRRGLNWSTFVENGRRWLLLREFPLPAGYNFKQVTVAVEVPTSYPAAELDMFYCFPPLSRVSGHQIPQTEAQEVIGGERYQRWSRHRGQGSQWRMGVDNVLTHLTLIEGAVAREVEA